MILLKNNINTLVWAGFSVMLYIIVSQIFLFPEPVLWMSKAIILFFLLRGVRKYAPFRTIDKYGYIITCAFILWLIIGFLKSCHYAEGYWMWKFIINTLLTTLFYSIISHLFMHYNLFSYFTTNYCKSLALLPHFLQLSALQWCAVRCIMKEH